MCCIVFETQVPAFWKTLLHLSSGQKTKDESMKLTTHLHLVLRLRINGVAFYVRIQQKMMLGCWFSLCVSFFSFVPFTLMIKTEYYIMTWQQILCTWLSIYSVYHVSCDAVIIQNVVYVPLIFHASCVQLSTRMMHYVFHFNGMVNALVQ